MRRDDANFINFCVGTGQVLTNGLQKTGGSCNGITMVYLPIELHLSIQGQIPSKDKMVSTIILSPQHNENIPQVHKTFNVVLAIDNLETGHFTNPDTTYYSAPQQLNKDGLIIGHTHITIQVRSIAPAALILCN